jgi:hypothetical protein
MSSLAAALLLFAIVFSDVGLLLAMLLQDAGVL